MVNFVGHVRLRKKPLQRAVCQLRYPAELGFDATLVRPLQKELAAEYPHVGSEKVVSAVTFVPDGKPSQVTFKDVFRFQTPDKGTTIQVTDEFIALETTTYDRFSGFANRWRRVVQAAVHIFELQVQLRLGLRYTNAIERPAIDSLDGWRGLIADPLLTGVRIVGETLGGVSTAGEQTILTKLDVGMCALRHGFPSISTIGEQLPHPAYILDIDSYDDTTQPINVEAQMVVLESWNRRAARLLRAAVTDELWLSFDPEEVS